MRVLVVLSSNPGDGYLVRLHTEELVREVKRYIDRRNHSKAIITALAKGTVERQVGRNEINSTEADLTLTRDRACWDVIRQ